jgi:putative heme degradation protein
MVDSGVIKNYITPKVVEWLGMLYKQKLKPYALVIILKELVLYRNRIINFVGNKGKWQLYKASCRHVLLRY